MKKLYIVDAVNYLFRSYYAIGPMTNDKGESTSALYGFIRSMQKIQKDFSTEHMIAVFDGPDNKSSRQAVYAEYKMNRKGAPEDLFPQFEWAYEYCNLAGIPTVCVEGVEADDTIASIANWAKGYGYEVYICSSDKDLFQLVSEHTFMLLAHKNNTVVDAEKVEEIYGVKPSQMLDFLAIMGDASDNIPGLSGFGPKTAANLLQQFKTLDYILEHPTEVSGKKKQQTLIEQKDIALMSRKLATLDTSVDIPNETSFYKIKEKDIESLISFFRDMKFTTLLKELGSIEETAPIKTIEEPEEIKYTLVQTEQELNELVLSLSQAKEICVDTETTSLNTLQASLVGIGFSTEPGLAWYVPLNGPLPKEKTLDKLQTLFESDNTSFFGHNIKYDYHILQKYNLNIKNISFDTMIASYLLTPQNRKHGLDHLSLEILGKHKIPIKSLIKEGKKQISMNEVDLVSIKEYCSEDVDYTYRLKSYFEKQLEDASLTSILREIEIPLIFVLARMEKKGIYLDANKLSEMRKNLLEQIQVIKDKIFEEVGSEFNLNSPKQLSEVLYTRLGLTPPTSRKKTEYSTGAKVLEMLADENAVVSKILEYRELEKLRSTYVEALPEQINSNTNRIHCTFNQSVAATGRLSCQDPNLQNIPIRGDEGRKIRLGFKPQKENWSYLSADYSQIELRLLAHFSEDPELIKAFKEEKDIHSHTAAAVFNIPISEVTKDMRYQAKAVNFGILYGQGPFGLSQETGISMRDASNFIKTYFARYPRVSQYISDCKKLVKEKKYATTLIGRKRPIQEIDNKNPIIRAAAERLAVNTPLQGTAADLIKIAMIQIDKEIQKQKLSGYMILQVHDELIFEVPNEELPIFEEMVKRIMESALTLKVPLLVDVKIGKNWAEC